MRDRDYEILRNEVMAIVNYAQSSRTIDRRNFMRDKQETFFNKLLYHIVDYSHDWFIDDFTTYSHARLKLALSTKDFSCLESIMYICYRFLNNPNVLERSKSEIKLLDGIGHKFLCLTREDKIISPIQKFSKHGINLVFCYTEAYAKEVYQGLQFQMGDFSFFLDKFKDIALIDPLPHELKEVVRPLREHGYI